MTTPDIVGAARAAAESLLRERLPRRWSHVQATATTAEMLARVTALGPDDREILVAAAWLHDIGYAPGLAETGFHPLDGARWLRTAGFGDRLAGLVAYHSCAVFEAEERGLAAVLRSEFGHEESDVRDALWYADLTTGPDGQPMTVRERLAEIRGRYGPDSVVTRTWDRAEPHVLAVQGRMLQARHSE